MYTGADLQIIQPPFSHSTSLTTRVNLIIIGFTLQLEVSPEEALLTQSGQHQSSSAMHWDPRQAAQGLKRMSYIKHQQFYPKNKKYTSPFDETFTWVRNQSLEVT